MSEQLMGVDYFSIATDIKDDDKIFELKYRYGMPEGAEGFDHAAAWAAYGRFIDLLASIYHNGFAVEVTKQYQLRMSQQLGISVSEFGQFVQTCVDVGLFDDGIWCRDHVLTSRGIQKRYFHAVKRRKGNIPEEMEKFILIGKGEIPGETAQVKDDASTMQTSCEHDANTVPHDAGYIKEKIREEDIRQEDKREDDRKGVSSSSVVENIIIDHVASTLTSPIGSERGGGQPYPLACFSCVADDGTVYTDAEGQCWDTPWDALLNRFVQRTGSSEISDFVRKVAKKCPANCEGTPAQVSECYALLSEALDKFDRSKAASPTPLALKVLEDRGKRKRKP